MLVLSPVLGRRYVWLNLYDRHAPPPRLEDFDNSCASYDKAIQLVGMPGEPIFHLNYGERCPIPGPLPPSHRRITFPEQCTSHFTPDISSEATAACCCSSECWPAVNAPPPIPPPTLCTAIMLQRHKEYEQSKLHLLQFRDLFDEQDEDVKHADQEIIDQAHALGRLLGI